MKKKLLLIAIILVSILTTIVRLERAPHVEAKFEVAGIAHDNKIPFKVRLRNVGTGTAEHLSIVATAGEAVERVKAPSLQPGEEQTVEGVLVLDDEDAGVVEFSARVIGEKTSHRSESIMVARPEGLGGARLYSQIQQAPLPVTKAQQLGTSLPKKPPMDSDVAYGALEEVEQESDVQHLISRVEQYQCDASQHTLEVYQQMGNEKADAFLLSKM